MPVVDTSAGFQYMGRLSEGPDLIASVVAKDTETLTAGDLINIESGQADLAATNDAALVGACRKTVAATTAVTLVEFYWAPDALYSVYDPNARAFGATLDIAGATGAQTVAASSNVDLIVVGGFLATERTIVMIHRTEHMLLA